MADVAPPAALAHMAAQLRAVRKLDVDIELYMPSDRRAELIIEKGPLRIWFGADRCGKRWIPRPPEGIRAGEFLDLSDGFAEAIRLLNQHDPGEPGVSAVHGVAGTSRDRGVEVRKTAVIRA